MTMYPSRPFYLSVATMLIFCFIGLSSCYAQRKTVEMTQCTKSNTGFRGRVPKEEMDKPQGGHDFYNITLHILQKSTIELVSLTVKNNEQIVSVKPQFDNGESKMSFSKGETGYIRADCDENITVVKRSLKSEGILTLKVNGKLTHLEVKTFASILPN